MVSSSGLAQQAVKNEKTMMRLGDVASVPTRTWARNSCFARLIMIGLVGRFDADLKIPFSCESLGVEKLSLIPEKGARWLCAAGLVIFRSVWAAAADRSCAQHFPLGPLRERMSCLPNQIASYGLLPAACGSRVQPKEKCGNNRRMLSTVQPLAPPPCPVTLLLRLLRRHSLG